MDKKKLAIIFTLLFSLSLFVCVGERIILEKSDFESQEVEAFVVSATQSRSRLIQHTNVIVYYNNEEVKLNGATSAYPYWTGKQITAYLSNGKLYESTQDIKGDTPLFIISFVAMWAMIISFVPMLSFWIDYNKKRNPKK